MLGTIWDEVVHRIVQEMMSLSLPEATPLHINVREDMALELAQLQFWLGERVIEKRTGGREIADIDRDAEREACLGAEGGLTITGTAHMAHEHIWKRRLDERWKPKSAKAAEREKNPRAAKLAVKPVGKNHFIPRWFIRDNWAVDGKVLRWRRSEMGWTSARRGFGEWGFRHKLYSDRLEAYLALLEGDAKRPIEMLLDTRPLNGPQRDALVGFLVIQVLRNPYFIEKMQRGIAPVIADEGYGDDPDMPSKAYETIYQNNELYDRMARPIMWNQWAIVRSEEPLFVLPDTFGLGGDLGDGLRMVVPLTPRACFVTLADRESEKRIVPHYLRADHMLATRISAALLQSAEREFISHPSFTMNEDLSAICDLLGDISQAVAARGEGD
ncbi:DUF4238 domain-containing protein [Sphingomonas sp. ID0503]|uniref:DUF4238 domain-containing protein n=1 Tax=Sphingomonas sp. ID0503 TaxID=3399691 RepID=UPI003AFB0764